VNERDRQALRRALLWAIGQEDLQPTDSEIANAVLTVHLEDKARYALWCTHSLYQAATDIVDIQAGHAKSVGDSTKTALRSLLQAKGYAGALGHWPGALTQDMAIDIQNWLEARLSSPTLAHREGM
jgi:hypothetical protein